MKLKFITMTGLILIFSTFVQANPSPPSPLKPGLWEMTMKMKSGETEIDPQAALKKSMEKMSPEQRKQMSAMLAKSGMSVGTPGEGGTKICYTKEQLDHGPNLGQTHNRHCESIVKQQTSKRMVMDFKCQDGSTGTGEWNFHSSTGYDGKMKFTKKDGKIMEMSQKGRFLSANCGDVKPFALPKKP